MAKHTEDAVPESPYKRIVLAHAALEALAAEANALVAQALERGDEEALALVREGSFLPVFARGAPRMLKMAVEYNEGAWFGDEDADEDWGDDDWEEAEAGDGEDDDDSDDEEA
jgi:hypothetical protein